MIKTDKELKTFQAQLQSENTRLDQQREILVEAGLTPRQLEAAMAPLILFRDQLAAEIASYRQIKSRDFTALASCGSIGRLLVAIRIAFDKSQHDLAIALHVDDAQISRWERDEYNAISLQKVCQILDALGVRLRIEVVPLAQAHEPERVPA